MWLVQSFFNREKIFYEILWKSIYIYVYIYIYLYIYIYILIFIEFHKIFFPVKKIKKGNQASPGSQPSMIFQKYFSKNHNSKTTGPILKNFNSFERKKNGWHPLWWWHLVRPAPPHPPRNRHCGKHGLYTQGRKRGRRIRGA